MPRNAASGHRYRGINVLTLGMSPLAFASGDPRWATYKQAEERGWQVRKGERGTTGYFFKQLELRGDTKPDGDAHAVRRIPLLRALTLFHASQIDDVRPCVPPTIEEAPWRAPEAAEIILANSGAVVRFGGDRAFYPPATDHIQMPPQNRVDRPAPAYACRHPDSRPASQIAQRPRGSFPATQAKSSSDQAALRAPTGCG